MKSSPTSPNAQGNHFELKSLFSWGDGEEEAVSSFRWSAAAAEVDMTEFNGLPAVTKRTVGDKGDGVSQEWLRHLIITTTMDRYGLTESEAGIVRLRKVASGDGASWLGTMGRCPVTLDRIFPAMYELLQHADTKSQALYQHVLFAVFSSLVRTLDTLYLAQIVHGDFKPQNVGSSPTDDPRYEGAQAAFDLGISRTKDELFATGQYSGVFAGTLAYMSKESFGNAPAHSARDVFACGKILEGLAQGYEVEFKWEGGSQGGAGNMFQRFYQLSEAYDRAHDEERDRLLKQYGKTKDCDDVLSVGGKPLSLMVREGINKEMQLREALRKNTDFMACYQLVIAQMCHDFPEYRPSLSLLKMAVSCMEPLLPPLPAGCSVSGFFKSVEKPPKEAMFSCTVDLRLDSPGVDA